MEQYTTLAQFAKLIADIARSSINKSLAESAKKSNVLLIDIDLLSKSLNISEKSATKIFTQLHKDIAALAKNPRTKIYSSRKVPGKESLKVSVGGRSSLNTVMKHVREAIAKELKSSTKVQANHTSDPVTIDKTLYNSELLSKLSGNRLSKEDINNIVDSIYKDKIPDRFNLLSKNLGLDIEAIHKTIVNLKKLDSETSLLLAIPEEVNRYIGSTLDQVINNEIANRIERQILKSGAPEDRVSISGLDVAITQLFKNKKILSTKVSNKRELVSVKLTSPKAKGLSIRTKGFKFEGDKATPTNKNTFTFTSLTQLMHLVNSQLQPELYKSMPHADKVGTSIDYLRYDTGNFSRIARVDLEFLKEGKEVTGLLIKPRFLEGSDGPVRYSTFIPPSGVQSSVGRDPSRIIGSAAKDIIKRYTDRGEYTKMVVESMSKSSGNRYII